MTVDELRVHLEHLINSYFTDADTKAKLLALVGRDEVPAKGILAEMTPYLSGVVTEADPKVIKDIVFNFC
ncbi:hypothetical protein LMG19083_04580 [Ralstonia psammae]|uniref:Uncharacterized protein n=1 Tax=Ralstonia psammae TaxID=3058598 RepID=A0ABN9JGN0_9RALS|nr:hypothetical protein [Ralstonia sp. LMG 19083]CAJ0807557.1 hypothetical protein LMG19083_04580 [Ralstonia sp. LMG 19083]